MSPDREREPPRPPEEFRQLLQDENRSFRLPLAEPVLSRLGAFLAELDLWRRKVNLTGRLSPAELAKHTLESVLGSKLIPHGARVVDIGSGAGFPGLPLAIAREDLQVALVEPRAKRSAFLRHVGRSLGLSNIEVIESRIEDLSGRAFDVATTRAVGRFAEWLGGAEFLADSASVLSWATDTEDLASALGARFRLEGSLPIPGSEKRRIVSFRRAS
jgi:16S rRNA (guanine527-N7)-methyltransferase